MIYDVFLPFLIIFSIFSIIIILARKIPDISLKEDISGASRKKGQAPHFPTLLLCFGLSSFEKILRQIRIHLLKFDTKIFSLIEYLRKESAKKLEDVNKLAHKSIAKTALEDNAHKISRKLQFKIEERKLLHTISRNPKEAENYKKLGFLYLENKNILDAEASFAEYLKLNPSDSEVLELMEKMGLKKE